MPTRSNSGFGTCNVRDTGLTTCRTGLRLYLISCGFQEGWILRERNGCKVIVWQSLSSKISVESSPTSDIFIPGRESEVGQGSNPQGDCINKGRKSLQQLRVSILHPACHIFA